MIAKLFQGGIIVCIRASGLMSWFHLIGCQLGYSPLVKKAGSWWTTFRAEEPKHFPRSGRGRGVRRWKRQTSWKSSVMSKWREKEGVWSPGSSVNFPLTLMPSISYAGAHELQLMHLCLYLVCWPLTSCKVDILKEIINLQPFILCSSTKNNHQGCVTTASCGTWQLFAFEQQKDQFCTS